MPFKDLREFIARLEKEGEAQQIEEEVDWNLEAGAMLRRSHEARLPAPFFQKIKDYPEGYRLFGGTLADLRRIAIAMDMDPDTSQGELMNEYLRRKERAIKPVLVNDGPCKENINRLISNYGKIAVPMLMDCSEVVRIGGRAKSGVINKSELQGNVEVRVSIRSSSFLGSVELFTIHNLEPADYHLTLVAIPRKKNDS